MARSPISTAKRVSYALGYVELGLLTEAFEELEAVASKDRSSIPVMLAHMAIHMAAKDWALLVTVAKAAAKANPALEQAWISWAYGQRRFTSVADARAVLHEAESHHGKSSALIHYNLACYECQLGEPDKALARLRQACAIGGPEFKLLALDDPDLQPMRSRVETLG